MAARLAADVMGVPTILLARTDAEAADLVTTDVDDNDKPFLTGERTVEGFYRSRNGIDQAISRGLAYAEYADLIWCETGTPDLAFAKKFADAKTGFGVGHDGREVVDVVLAFAPLDLVSAGEGGIDLLDDLGHRIHRVQRLVGVHLAIAVGVSCHLPAAQVDRLQASLDLLHGLVARQCAQAVDERLGVDQVPQLVGTALGQRVVDLQRAAQAHHIGGAVAALDAFPTRVFSPVFFDGGNLLFAGE